MKLEQDARSYTEKVRTSFLKELNRVMRPLDVYIRNNLHDTKERDKASTCLEEVKLWARECAEKHGIK